MTDAASPGSTSNDDLVAAAERPLRADAERNRRKIIEAARELFAERGLTTLDEVAERAGVGVGTVYRRFPSRDDLIDALYVEAMEQLVAIGSAAVELSETDPWGAIEYFLTNYLEMHAGDRSLSSVVLTDAHGRGRLEIGKSKMAPMGATVVARAKAAGVVRDDFAPTELPMSVIMLVSVMNATRDVAPGIWRRYLAYLLDSFRPEAARGPLPHAPLEFDQVPLAMRAAFSGR
ncbi:MAG: TetR/AcrR family transcriptional regulator [Solirubrobacteraceae bacterium]|nr:TetR/AcrR family transcriptional regulator [Solirubrobacteraceae bacterium]